MVTNIRGLLEFRFRSEPNLWHCIQIQKISQHADLHITARILKGLGGSSEQNQKGGRAAMYMTAVIKTAAKANKVSKVPIVCSTSSPRRAPTYWDIKTVPPEAKPIIKM